MGALIGFPDRSLSVFTMLGNIIMASSACEHHSLLVGKLRKGVHSNLVMLCIK